MIRILVEGFTGASVHTLTGDLVAVLAAAWAPLVIIGALAIGVWIITHNWDHALHPERKDPEPWITALLASLACTWCRPGGSGDCTCTLECGDKDCAPPPFTPGEQAYLDGEATMPGWRL